MSTPALSVPADAPIEMALGFMEAHGLHRVPVVETGVLVGMATKDALVRAVESIARGHRPPKALFVSDLATKAPPTIGPETTLEEAARLMVRHNVEGLAVVQGGRLVGILTKSDFFRVFLGLCGLGGATNVWLSEAAVTKSATEEPFPWEMQSAGR
jgi:CBS domain-containing protein